MFAGLVFPAAENLYGSNKIEKISCPVKYNPATGTEEGGVLTLTWYTCMCLRFEVLFVSPELSSGRLSNPNVCVPSVIFLSRSVSQEPYDLP